jgi:hypothetical protein
LLHLRNRNQEQKGHIWLSNVRASLIPSRPPRNVSDLAEKVGGATDQSDSVLL